MEEKVKAVAVDDDPYALASLQRALLLESDVELVAAFEDPFEALEFIQSTKPDLLFLDIHMPGLSGFDLLDRLGDDVPQVVFVTAFDQYAIRAIRYSALDYLVKPIDQNVLKEALKRLQVKLGNSTTKGRLINLRENLAVNDQAQWKVVFVTKQGDRQFNAIDIVRCEADSNYSMIYLRGGKRFLASKTLGDVEEMLESATFLRIHKSHLINALHARKWRSEFEVEMSDDSIIPISRRRVSEMRDKLSDYVG